MKQFKRTLALFLAFVMLAGLLPVSVFAEELQTCAVPTPEEQKDVLESDLIPFYPTLTVGEKTKLSFSPGEVKRLVFVPESDGTYCFYSDGIFDTVADRCDHMQLLH